MWSPTRTVQLREMQSLQVVMSALHETIAKKNGNFTELPLGFIISWLQRGFVEINVDAFRLLVMINRFETEILPKARLLEPSVRRLR